MKDEAFETSREVLQAKRKALKGDGKGNRPNKADYLDDDMINELWECKELGEHTPKSLQNTLFFYFTSGFGFRGCNENKQLKWGDISLKESNEGIEYLEFQERLTKTRNGEEGSTVRYFHPKIFATDSDRCPIRMYKAFREKRPIQMCEPDSPFYLSAKTKLKSHDPTWYSTSAMGKNTLAQIMRKMAEIAKNRPQLVKKTLF